MVTIIFILVALIYGLKNKKNKKYFLYSFGAIISNFLAHFLFQGGGTLLNPEGDGIITALFRQHFNDGPLVLIGFPLAIILGYILPFFLLRKIWKDR